MPPSEHRRHPETRRSWYRAEPVFQWRQGGWYFHTREGIDIGPYDSRRQAEFESAALRSLIRRSGGGGEARRALREFILESFAMGRPLRVMIRSDIEHVSVEELPPR